MVAITSQIVTLDQLAVKETRMENDTEHATIIVLRGNDDFNYTRIQPLFTAGCTDLLTMTATLTSYTLDVIFELSRYGSSN